MKGKTWVHVVMIALFLCLSLCGCGRGEAGGKQDQGVGQGAGQDLAGQGAFGQGSSGQGAGSSAQGTGGAMQLVPQEGEHYYITTYGILTTPVNAWGFRVSGGNLYSAVTDFEKGINRYYRESLSGNVAREELFIGREVYQEVTEDSILFCPGEEDSLYFILAKEEDNGNRRYFILRCGLKGEELLRKEITGDLTDDVSKDLLQPQGFVLDGEGRACLAVEGGILLYDKDMEYQGKISERKAVLSLVEGRDGKVYYTRKDPAVPDGELELAEVDFDGKKSVEVCSDFPGGYYTDSLSAGERYDFLVSMGDGLYGCSLEGQKAEKILDWLEEGTTASQVMYVFEEGGEYRAVERSDSLQLARVREVAKEEMPPEKERIVLGSVIVDGINTYVDYSEFMRLIDRFNKSQDQYLVEYRIYGEKDENEFSLGGMEKLSLELAAGSGPDLIQWNPMIPAYARRGVVEDLTGYVEKSQVMSLDNFLEQGLEMYTFDGKLAVLPPGSLNFDTLYGYSDQIGEEAGGDLSRFLELAAQYPQTPLFESSYPFGMLRDICVDYRFPLTDGENLFPYDSEEFRNFLEYCKEGPKVDQNKYHNGETVLGEDYLIDKVGLQLYSSMAEVLELRYGEREKTIIGYPVADGVGIYLWPGFHSRGLAISATSSHKEGAWAFIEYLYERTGGADFFGGLRVPVRKDQLEKELAALLGTTVELSEGSHVVTEEDIDFIRDLIDAARPSYGRIYDELWTLDRIIREETEIYFAGDKPLEETTDVLQSRLKLYFSENFQ